MWQYTRTKWQSMDGPSLSEHQDLYGALGWEAYAVTSRWDVEIETVETFYKRRVSAEPTPVQPALSDLAEAMRQAEAAVSEMDALFRR